MPRMSELPASEVPATDDMVPILDASSGRLEAVTIAQIATAVALDATNLSLDASISSLALPANTTISTFGASLVDDADAATARTTLGAAAAADLATTVVLTQAEYNALTPDADTIYYVVN